MDADREQVRAWVETMDAQGYTSDEIRAQLALAGWTKEEIEGLMGAPAAPAPQPPVAPPVTTSSVPPPVLQPSPVGQAPVVQPPVPQPAVTLPPTPGQATTPAYTPGPMAAQPSGTATAALVLGLVSLLLGPLTAIIGLILGIVAMKRGDPGRGMALVGLIISAVVLFGYLVLAGLLLLGLSLADSAVSNSLEGAPRVEDAANTVSDETSASEDSEIAADEVRPDNGESLLPGAADQGDTQVVCLGRMKMLGLAMKMYVSDYDGYLPDAAAWPAALAPYTKDAQTLRCPADRRKTMQKVGKWTTSYTMYEPTGGTMTNTLPDLGKAYLLFDGTQVSGEESAADFRHEGGLVLGYVDGHAQWVSEAKFRQPD